MDEKGTWKDSPVTRTYHSYAKKWLQQNSAARRLRANSSLVDSLEFRKLSACLNGAAGENISISIPNFFF